MQISGPLGLGLDIPVMHSCFEIQPQYFSQVEVRTLTEPIQVHSFCFLFRLFVVSLVVCFRSFSCCKTIISLSPVRQMASHLTLEYFGNQRSSWWLQNNPTLSCPLLFCPNDIVPEVLCLTFYFHTALRNLILTVMAFLE